MGKRYRCEYCDKLMVSSPQIVKTHNKGLIHQTLVREHYQQYKGKFLAVFIIILLPPAPCFKLTAPNITVAARWCKF